MGHKDIPQEVPGKKDVPNEGLQGAAQAAWRGGDNVAQAGADAVVGNPEQGAMFLASLTQRPGDPKFQTDALTQAVTQCVDAGVLDRNVGQVILAARQDPEILKKMQTSA